VHCHESHEKAVAQLRALYVSEEKTMKKELREKRRDRRLRAAQLAKQKAAELDVQEEIDDEQGEEPGEEEQVMKDYMEGMSAPAYMLPVGPVSWEELDALEVTREKAEAVQEVSWQVRDLVNNVLCSPMSPKEKAQAIQGVGDGFAERVQMAEDEFDTVEKSIDTDLLELEVLIAKDNRHIPFTEKVSDFVSKAVLTTAGEKKLSDSDFALVYTDENGKKVRKYPIHDKAHVRNALARAAQQIKAGGTGAADAKKALPKIRAAAKKMGIGQMEKSASAVLVEKDLTGNWRAVMWPSNNFKDLDGEIITEAAHMEYVDWVNKNMDMTPVFTTWHEPGLVRKNQVDFVGYEDGFLIMSAPLEQDEAVALLKAQLVTDIGMSHGSIALERDPQNTKHITKYLTVEVSDLPLENAANPFTDFETLISKEADMNIKDYLASMLGPEKAEAFMEKTNMKQKALREAGVEEKAAKTEEPEAKPVEQKPSDTPTPATALDMDAILKAVRADIGVEDLNELLTKASEAMEKVPVLEAVIKELSASKETELAEMITPKVLPTFVWQKKRASNSEETVLNKENEEDKKLSESKPTVGWFSELTHTTPLQ
jgi:hypothetical protein